MHNPNDPIENFFRQSIDRSFIEFNEDDWRKMEKMLEDDARHRAIIFKRWAYSGLVIAASGLGSMLFFFLRQGEQEKTMPKHMAHSEIKNNSQSFTKPDGKKMLAKKSDNKPPIKTN